MGPQEGGGRAHGGWWWAPPSSRHCSPGPGRSRRRIKKKKESPHTPRGSWRRPASARGGGGGREQGGGGGGAAGQFVQARAPLPGGRAPGTVADNDLLPAGAGRGPAAPQPSDTEKATRWAEAVAFVASAFAVATEWRATCRRPWPRLSVVDSRGPYIERNLLPGVWKTTRSWMVLVQGSAADDGLAALGSPPPPGQPHEDGLGRRWSPRGREDGRSVDGAAVEGTWAGEGHDGEARATYPSRAWRGRGAQDSRARPRGSPARGARPVRFPRPRHRRDGAPSLHR